MMPEIIRRSMLNVSSLERMTSKLSPKTYPISIKRADHVPAPSAVNSENSNTFMRANPAGSDINERIPGTNLPMNVVI